MAELDQQFIEYVVKNLVDHPDEVQLKRSIDDRGVLLELIVHPDDMGKIIGRQSQIETPPSGGGGGDSGGSGGDSAPRLDQAPGSGSARSLTLASATPRAGGRGGGDTYLTVNVQGSVTTQTDLITAVHQGLLAKQRRDATLGFQ